MFRKDLYQELKKQGYNKRSIQDYFRYCKIWKYEVSLEGFKNYIFELSRIKVL